MNEQQRSRSSGRSTRHHWCASDWIVVALGDDASERIRQPLPPALEQIVMSCLAKNPKDRPADARVLAHLLTTADLANSEAWDDANMHAWWEQQLPPRPMPVADGSASHVFLPKSLTH